MGPRTVSSNITGHMSLLFLTSSTHLLSSPQSSSQTKGCVNGLWLTTWTRVSFLGLTHLARRNHLRSGIYFFFHTRKSVHFYRLPDNADQIQIGPSAVRLPLQMAPAVGGWHIPPQRIHSTCHNSNKVAVCLSIYLMYLSILCSNMYQSQSHAMPSIVLGI